MRVLEQKPALTQNMGKKKHKLRKHSKENANFPTDSSDESHQAASGPQCSHINKSINISTMRKALKQLGSLSQCTSCSREAASGSRKTHEAPGETSDLLNVGISSSCEDLMMEAAEPTLWVCLQCGHLGCDRNSKEKHGLKHFQTPRSSSHAVVVNTSTWLVWCYSCDDECPVESSRKLQECVDLLKRLASGDALQPPPATAGQKGSISKADIPVTVAEGAGEIVSRESEEKEKSKYKNKVVAANPFVGIPLPKVYGLSNLGNTCFFNAVMQNLSHTYILRELLTEYSDRGLNICLTGSERHISESECSGSCSSDEESDEKSLMDPLNLTLPECGALTKSMVGFLGEMKLGNDTQLRTGSNNIVNPGRLFGQICKKTPRFKGFQQQDSHELLRHLLEGMKNEEIKRSQAAILKAFNLENVHAKKVDDDTKQKIKEYGRQVKHTFVDSVFGGYFISTVLCEECHVPSQIFEPFQDISLPILEDKPTRPNNFGGARKKDMESKTKSPERVLTGVDGFAAMNRPSKHASRKSKKQAKKEAKRKVKNKLKAGGDEVEAEKKDAEKEDGGEEKEDGENGDKTTEDKDNEKSDQHKEGSGSDWDSKSDADVEDNIESDVSRKRIALMQSMSMEDLQDRAANPTSCDGCDREGKPDTLVQNGNNINYTNEADGLYNATAKEPSLRTHSPLIADNMGDIEDGLRTLNLEDRNISPAALSNTDGRNTPLEAMTNGPIAEDAMCNGDVFDGRKSSSSSPDPTKSPKLLKANISKKEQHRDMKLKAMQTLVPRNQPAAQECSIMSCLNQFTTGELLTGNNKFGCERCTRNKYKNMDVEAGKRETVYTNASKQLQIFIPPAILTLHLKRFQQVGFSLRKVNRHVDFPLDLDLAPYCSALSLGVRPGQTSIKYSLYGVVEHSGRLTGGHYTAYVKVRNSNSDLKKFLQFHDINGLNLKKVLEMMKTKASQFNDNTKDDEATSAPAGRWYYMSDTRVSEASESNVLRCQAYLLFYERIQ